MEEMTGPERESLYDVRQRLEANFRQVEAILREAAASAEPRVRLAAATEMRHHIARAAEREQFMEAVLDVLGEESAALRERVLKRLEGVAQ
jgi:hypothetical protein